MDIVTREKLLDKLYRLDEPYKWIRKDKDLRKERTFERILEGIKKEVKGLGFVGFDNPDTPIRSILSEEGRIRLVERLISSAIEGEFPFYIVLTLNKISFDRIIRYTVLRAKISQHFDVIYFNWNPDDLEKAVKRRLEVGGWQYDSKVVQLVCGLAKTPRAAICLVGKLTQPITEEEFLVRFSKEGLLPAFNYYCLLYTSPSPRDRG